MAMSLEKRQKIAAERRQLILDSALSLFDEKGYFDTTIADIAGSAGISTGLIYQYFNSKIDILLSYGDAIRDCEEEVKAEPTPQASLKMFARRVLMKYKYTNYRAPLRVLIYCYLRGEVSENPGNGFSFKDYGRRFFGPIIRQGQEDGTMRTGDPEELADIFWHTVIGYNAHLMNAPQLELTEEDIDRIVGLLLR